MDVEALVVRDGDRVTATGRLVRNDSGDWFEPPLPVALPGGVTRRVRPVWGGAIAVVGADFTELNGRFELDGEVEGFATLTGIWSAGRLRVERQASPLFPQPPRWVTPPCPPPAGGWPHLTRGHGDDNIHFDLGDLRETGAAAAATVFRPSEDQAVLVVAAADQAAVEAHLRPQLGPLLCVIPSAWRSAELDAVRAHLHARHQTWNLYQWGHGTAETGQPQVTACLTRVLPEIAAWAAALPSRHLALKPWLTREAASVTSALPEPT